jgi:L-ascorbate metabolism protein UlaG (beta-lactamase superfamily)
MKVLLSNLALTALLSLAACETTEFIAASKRPFVSPETENLSVTFFGTTSFLIETPQSQIILDGYLSRPRHMLFKKIYPNPELITRILLSHGVCPTDRIAASLDENDGCRKPAHKHLEAVLPLHGHYDHAMDSGFIAGWTGARMLSNRSLDRMFLASKAFASERGFEFQGSLEANIELAKHIGPDAPPIEFADMSVHLFESPHNENLISRNLDKETAAEFKFPATIWRMGEGDSIAALITYRDSKILFMGSAGQVNNRLLGVDAQVVFLSIGGIGLMNRDERAAFWDNAVIKTGARRVFLTHWDNHQRALPTEGVPLKPTWFEPHDKVLAHLQELSGSKVQLLFPAIRMNFDPLYGLSER